MKFIVTKFFAVIVFIAIFNSCLKTPNHSMRIKNLYSIAMTNVSINSTSYGSILSGATTDYKPIDEGNFTVSGATVNGQTLTGSGTVTGNGTHKWTTTITSSGTLSLTLDQ